MAFTLKALSLGELFGKTKTWFSKSYDQLTDMVGNLVEALTDSQTYKFMSRIQQPNIRYTNVPTSESIDPVDYGFLPIRSQIFDKCIQVLQKYSSLEGGITFSDDQGHQFPLSITADGRNTNYQGIKVFVRNTVNDSDINNFLLICKQDANQTSYYVKTYWNGITSNGSIFSNPITDAIVNNFNSYSVTDRLNLLATVISGAGDNNSYKEVLNNAFDLGFTDAALASDDEIESKIVTLEYAHTGPISLTDIMDTNSEHPTINFKSLLSQLSKSANLSNILSNITQVIVNNDDEKANIVINTISSSKDSSFNDPAIQAFIDSYNTSGLRGLRGTLLQFLQSTTSISSEEDHITFTQNEQFIPKSFFVGLVTGQFYTISAITQAIGAIFSYALGPIIQLGWNVIVGLFGLIDRGYDSLTLGSYDTNKNFTSWPISVINYKTTINDLEDIAYDWATMLKDYGTCTLQLPGCVFIFAKEVNSNDVYIEMHITPITPETWNVYRSTLNAFNPWTSYLVDGYAHFYFGCTDSNRQTYLNALWQTFSQFDFVGSFISYTNEEGLDREEYDRRYRLMYEYGFCMAVFHLLLFFSGSSTFILKPWNSDGSSAYGSDNLSQAIETLINQIHSNTISSAPTWTDITSGVGFSYLFKLFYYCTSTELDNIKYTVSPGLVYSFYTDFIHILYESASWMVDYNYLQCDPEILSFDIQYTFTIPQFDRSSIVPAIVSIVLTTAAIAGIATVTVLKLRKALQSWNAKRRGRAEQAWSNYTDNPTDENYQAYRKQAFYNNILTKVTGGTKLDMTSYWDEPDVSGDDPNENETPAIGDIYEVITGDEY